MREMAEDVFERRADRICGHEAAVLDTGGKKRTTLEDRQ
jgi:hypothetical protein